MTGCDGLEAELTLLSISKPDSGPVDAGPDAGRDAGVDAGPDAGPDAGVDAGSDAGPDAGVDAGPGCNLVVSPSSIDFGKVIVGNSLSQTITLFNDGGATCRNVLATLTPTSNPSFTLSDTKQDDIEPGTGATETIIFTPGNAILPLFRTANLEVETIEGIQFEVTALFTGSVAADCAQTSKVIYTFDQLGNLSTFDPTTLTFTSVATLGCRSFGAPFSMSVDENGVAWTLYTDGNLYQVDTLTGACYTTAFQPDQLGFDWFGMGDVFRSPTNTDELFIASFTGLGHDQLGTLDFATLNVASIGPLPISGVELAGTGDGELWGFSPDPNNDNNNSAPAELVQIDWSNGNILQTLQLTGLPAGSQWAMKYFGGAFWIFVDTQIYQVDRATLTQSLAVDNTHWGAVVGAGVSTCASLQFK
jgi:hypothetical protein